MATLLYTHEACVDHHTGDRHPESPDRLRSVWAALAGAGFDRLVRREAPEASRAQLSLAHRPDYVDAVLAAIPETGRRHLDPDTVVSPASGAAALRGAGAVVAAVDAIMTERDVGNAFCAVRPPGHHAERARSMGFCLFNNIAVGALHARARHGLRRPAVIDFDVHHGNGTQHMFENDEDLFYASSHQAPFYPGTGAKSETGAGNIVNAPLAAGAGSVEFRAAYEDDILPALRAFDPDILFVSAGFDGHADDPLAQLRLTEDDYRWITRELLAVAKERCGGRVVSALEGGYDLGALARSTEAHVLELMSA